MSSEANKAKAALDQARAEHARALIAARDNPEDPQTKQKFRDAVKAGRDAWKGYQSAATAGLAAQIEAIVPGEFRD